MKNIKEWVAAEASVDMNARTVKIQAQDLETTFTSINVSLNARELLDEINQELVRAKAGVYIWKITPVQESSSVRHLFPDGRIPALSNAHTRADVTGYALLEDHPYLHTLAYVGLAARKTTVESLWASLIRARAGNRLGGVSILADGEIKMITQSLSEFNVVHAGIVCRKALPRKWEAQDDVV